LLLNHENLPMGIVTLTWLGRREGGGRRTVPIMLRFGCTFPGARY
jgi:hypothetical protein